MHALIRPLADLGPLRDPILVAGFADHGGATAAAAVQYLVDQWDARPIAEVDPDELFDFTVRRPTVRLDDEGRRVLDWPTSRFYLATPPGAGRDVVLLVGIEPHLRWRTFCEAVASFMAEAGITTGVLLGSYGGPTPHTRPTPVRLTAGDEALAERFGLPLTAPTYEGPTSIVGVLNVHLRAAGFSNAALIAMTPFYVGADPNPHAAITLIEALDRGLGTSTPVAALREQAQALDRHAEQAVRESQQIRTLVQSLEQQYDWIGGSKGAQQQAPTATIELPASEDVVAGVEAFLRQQRGSKGSSAGDRPALA